MTDIMVLCYHAVSPSWAASLSVTPEALERQLARLVHRGWHATTFTEAVLRPPARRTLAVTFDDAFASVRERAEPILSALGIPATVFVPTAFMSARQPLSWHGIDRWAQAPEADELMCMTWSDLGELAERGWEIGSHTHTHPRLTALDEKTALKELVESRETCSEHLGQACRSIAYPYGDVDVRVATLAGEAGYLTGACLKASLTPAEPLRWPRVGVYHGDHNWRYRLKITSVSRSLRASRMADRWLKR